MKGTSGTGSRAVATVVLALLAGPAVTEDAARPNVLVLLSDDQRTDAVSAWGNPYVETPHLDALVRRGFSFREAHVMGSHHGAVCAPSRAMILSGRQLFRVYDDLDGVPTLPGRLREAGYATFGTGKWHQSRESFARSFAEGRAVFFGGMSDHARVPVQELREDGTYTEVREVGFSSELFADEVVRFLDSRAARRDGRPFFAWVAFTAPHDPRTPPDEYLERYPPEAVPLPGNFLPLHPFHNGWMTGRDEQLAAWPRDPGVIRSQIAEYYGLVTHMDAQVGRIVAALRRHGLLENTLVVFASDNGLALGSHGLLGKQSLYEHSTRVPVVVAGPGVPHGESDALVYLHDLFPTIAGRARLAPVPETDGEDLAPVWEGRRSEVRETLFTAYEDLQRSVRDGRWKLIRYPRLDHTQLFDLRRDPLELHDRAAEPGQASRVAQMMALLEEWQERTGDPHPLTAETQDDMAYDHTTFERTPDRHQPESVRRKYFP